MVKLSDKAQSFDPRAMIRQRLEPLVGAKITLVDGLVDETCGRWEAWPILVLSLPDGTERTLLIGRDPEGNGPGWIEIVEGGERGQG
jgi:hypothetical protein